MFHSLKFYSFKSFARAKGSCYRCVIGPWAALQTQWNQKQGPLGTNCHALGMRNTKALVGGLGNLAPPPVPLWLPQGLKQRRGYATALFLKGLSPCWSVELHSFKSQWTTDRKEGQLTSVRKLIQLHLNRFKRRYKLFPTLVLKNKLRSLTQECKFQFKK